MKPAFDVLIVGGGMAGASLAWQLLASPEAAVAPLPRVLLIEREVQPGQHSTGRSAALFMESYGPAGVQALTRASRSFYTHPPAGFAAGPLVTPRGALYIAAADEVEALWAMQAQQEALGARFERCSSETAMQRVPALRPGICAAALYEPDVMDMDVHAIHQGYLRGFRQAGGQVWCAAAPTDAVREAEGWHLSLEVAGEMREVQTRVVVNAAGAWADELAALLGLPPVGLVPKRRSAFTFEPPAGLQVRDWPMLLDVHERFFLKPDAGLLLGSPANADPVPPHDVQPELHDIALGIERIQRVLEVEIRRPRATWAGLRCFVADGEPVIGWDGTLQSPSVFWLAAQGGYGIQSAPGASWLAASLLRGGPLPERLAQALAATGVEPAHFAPDRLRR